MIRLTLPYPISANRYWRSFVPRGHSRAIVTLSDEAKDYRKAVLQAVALAGIRDPIVGRFAFDVKLYPNRPQDWKTRQRKYGDSWSDTVMCIDLDNANKVLLDALKAVAIEDDKWLRKITGERMEPDEHGGRVVVTITPLATLQPQAALELA